MSEENNVDWITERRRCGGRGQGAFDAIMERIREDVAQANELAFCAPLKVVQEEQRWAGHYEVRTDNGGFPIRASITLQSNQTTKIAIPPTSARSASSFMVDHNWDVPAARCKFLIDGEEVQLWQISERALMPLIFPDEV